MGAQGKYGQLTGPIVDEYYKFVPQTEQDRRVKAVAECSQQAVQDALPSVQIKEVQYDQMDRNGKTYIGKDPEGLMVAVAPRETFPLVAAGNVKTGAISSTNVLAMNGPYSGHPHATGGASEDQKAMTKVVEKVAAQIAKCTMPILK